jgi:predicted DsbA family dithiol-disulfide isomerase
MHDLLFERHRQLDATKFQEWAAEIGVDSAEFSTCLAEPAEKRVRQDAHEAREMGITGTPTFLIGTLEADGRIRLRESIVGLPSLTQLRELIATVSTSTAAQRP